MTSIPALHSQPLPPAANPGPMPGTREPEVWTNAPFAQLRHSSDVTRSYPLVPTNLRTTGDPNTTDTPTWPDVFVPLGSAFNDAIAAAAKLSYASAAMTRMSLDTVREVPTSQTVAVLQVKDGGYFATGARIIGADRSFVPAAGIPLVDENGKPVTFDFTKSSDSLKALVWADQWIDFSGKHAGETARVGAA